MMFGLVFPIYDGYSIYWPPADRPMSVEVVENFLEHVNVDICCVPPSILGEISESEFSLKKLRSLEYVSFSGGNSSITCATFFLANIETGPLPASAGERILKYTRIVNITGSTENGLQPLYQLDPEDWLYFQFNPELKGIQFREVGEGLYENVITHDPSTDRFNMTWHTFPSSKEFPTKDLYRKHPTKPNLWKYVGRSDDIIVLSNGEKIHAKAMEQELYGEREVRDALIVGQGRFQLAVIFELKNLPPSSDREKEEIVEKLMPYIEKANKKAPAHGRITRDHIAFAKAEKPLLRAAKGTVQRLATLKAYEKEIDQLYAESQELGSSKTVYINPKDELSMTKSLSEVLSSAAGVKNIRPDQDFFLSGIDSLGIMSFVRQLKRSFTVHKTGVSPNSITTRLAYANPTVLKLAAALHTIASQKEVGNSTTEQLRINETRRMLEKYSSGFQRPQPISLRRRQENITVVLTGSTGSLGSYLLDALLALQSVGKVYCLNRGTDSQKRQEEASKARGLSTDWEGRVEFLQAAMGQPQLGLCGADYKRLRTEVGYIIRKRPVVLASTIKRLTRDPDNQWQVDFNLSLQSFEPHVAGVRNLVNFSLSSSYRPPILFTSSISTVGNWPSKHPGIHVPEEAMYDESVTSAMGYAESKYVGERLLEKASQVARVGVDICRVGQIAGPVINEAGQWNRQEWLPTIIASSKYLGKLPSSLGSSDIIDWIPVDILSNIIIDLMQASFAAQTSEEPYAKFHHLANPRRTTWSSLLPTIVEHLRTPESKVQVVPLGQWLMALQDSVATTKPEDVNRNPGLKLIDFYEGMAEGEKDGGVWLETRETEKESETMRSLQGVGPQWMDIWLKQWNF